MGDIQSIINNGDDSDDWIYAAGVFESGLNLRLHVNDLMEMKSTLWTGIEPAANNNLTIGKRSDVNEYFSGLIDEVRISLTARSEDWIKATYNNQSNSAGFISFIEEKSVNDPYLNKKAVVLYVATNNSASGGRGLYRVLDNGIDPVLVDELGDLTEYPRTIALNPNLQGNIDMDIIYSTAGAGKVYKSINGGQSFVLKEQLRLSDGTMTTLPDSRDFKVIDISKANPNYLYLSVNYLSSNNPFYSHDGGETWNEPEDLDVGNLHFTDTVWWANTIATHPTNEFEAIVPFAKSRISRTVDGGANWKYEGNGYRGGAHSRNKTSTHFGIFDSGSGARALAYFLMDHGPIVTYDEGDTWDLVFTDDIRVNDLHTTTVGAIAHDNQNTYITPIGGWGNQKITVTDNNWESWTVIDGSGGDSGTEDTEGDYQFISFDPQNSQKVYAGMFYAYDKEHGSSWISNNKGQTWTKHNGKLIRAIAYDENNSSVYLFALSKCTALNDPLAGCEDPESNTMSVLLISKDSGDSWLPVIINPFKFRSVYDVDAVVDGNEGRLYVAAEGALWRYSYCIDDTQPGCGTPQWDEIGESHGIPKETFGEISPVNTFSAHSVVIDPTDPNIVYVGMWAPGQGHRKDFIFRSLNRGETWENIAGDLGEYSTVHGLSVDPLNGVLHMSSNIGNYVLCTDFDGDSYTAEGGICGVQDYNDNIATAYIGASVVSNIKWLTVSAGDNYSLGVKSDGTLWAWGANSFGQLGDGSTTDRHNPVQIGSDTKWLTVSAGVYHSLGVKSDGTLWAWGANSFGQLGDDSTINRHNPVQIGNDTEWLTVSAGDNYSLGVKSDGTLWAWGVNSFGQLGDDSTINRHNPVQIGTGIQWVTVFTGNNHSLGVKSDGTLWAWGANSFGQLGDGSTINRHNPVQIGTDIQWMTVSAGDNYSLGVKSDGTLWAWGANSFGQLGDGSTTDRHSPVQIGTDIQWLTVSAGVYHSLATKSDGTLWAWGANYNGQLGDGSAINRYSPAQIGTDTQWVTVSAGYIHNLSIKSDNTLWAWGNNSSGQLGSGSTTHRPGLVQFKFGLKVMPWLYLLLQAD